MDLARAEEQLNALVEKRAKGRQAANAAEASWREPTRRRREQTRRANALAWADHYASLARAHHYLATSCAARADTLREQLETERKTA